MHYHILIEVTSVQSEKTITEKLEYKFALDSLITIVNIDMLLYKKVFFMYHTSMYTDHFIPTMSLILTQLSYVIMVPYSLDKGCQIKSLALSSL